MNKSLEARVRVLEEGLLLGAAGGGERPVLMGWGKRPTAATPMELMLIALGGCTAIDIYSLLTERGASITDLEVLLEAERKETPPRRLKRVKLTYVVEALGAGKSEAEEAVKLSMEKYCSVGATLTEGGVELETELIFKKPARLRP